MQAREYCCLGHILSLWETISVELARQLYLRGQVKFNVNSGIVDQLDMVCLPKNLYASIPMKMSEYRHSSIDQLLCGSSTLIFFSRSHLTLCVMNS